MWFDKEAWGVPGGSECRPAAEQTTQINQLWKLKKKKKVHPNIPTNLIDPPLDINSLTTKSVRFSVGILI